MGRGARIGLALLALIVGVAAWMAVVAVRRARTPAATFATASSPLPDTPRADWCAPGFDPIAGGGCLAEARVKSDAAALVIYLHGRYSRDAPSEEIDRQRRLGERATARGLSVLAMRGLLGECTAPELAEWFCWPSNGRNADDAAAFVNAWSLALATAQERVGARTRYVLGFSNGGYFAGLLAVRELFEASAFVIAHGGPVDPVRPSLATPPILLLSADDDIAQEEMIRFDEALASQSWAHDSYARFGGHALTDEDIDAAIDFFSRAREPLPLHPPLTLHRAVRHAHPAEDAAMVATPEDAGDETE